jgi:hypothetical protein
MKKLFIMILFISINAYSESRKYRVTHVKTSDIFLCGDYYESQGSFHGLECRNEKTKVEYVKIIINGEVLIEKLNTK